jgi:hypothetical protein
MKSILILIEDSEIYKLSVFVFLLFKNVITFNYFVFRSLGLLFFSLLVTYFIVFINIK